MRWIDADALIEKFGDWYIEEGPEEGFIGTLGQLLSEQPETNCSEIPNSSDTISRQAAIDALKEKVFRNLTDEFYGAMQVLDELPSAQPEIIRCKDCKYYKYGICMKIGANKSFHGFCDWAERGEQDE